ncbi:PadR family transcriptional regulator [Guptibacillus hwajinpoensis]|uniref:PadR family transcriptional regulator n=1 Tax=Guptibacillus hwajinpoensis TaxID=208199 RepID=UPI003736BD72
MSKDSNTKYAILGLLTTECTTGYSMKQMIDGSLNHFWKISYGQIYPILKSLVEEGYASVRITEQDDRPAKKEYSITLKGEKELNFWLQKPLQEIPTEKNELLLKLFFSRHQDVANSIELLDQQQNKLQDRYNTYLRIKKMITTELNDELDSVYWILTLDYGLVTTRAAIDWCEDSKSKLRDQKEE